MPTDAEKNRAIAEWLRIGVGDFEVSVGFFFSPGGPIEKCEDLYYQIKLVSDTAIIIAIYY